MKKSKSIKIVKLYLPFIYSSQLIYFLFIILLLQGCSVVPSEKDVTDLITRYFEAKKYKVIEIDIKDITPIPVSKYAYMGTKAYTIDIQTITLEPVENIGSSLLHAKGKRQTFKNGTIKINERINKKGEWIITNISGISII